MSTLGVLETMFMDCPAEYLVDKFSISGEVILERLLEK